MIFFQKMDDFKLNMGIFTVAWIFEYFLANLSLTANANIMEEK